MYESFIQRPHGIILVTGPTGSGKPTTLYASLNKINDPTRNIITVEDPVEYNLAGINQMPVNHKIGITFATGLRTIVRQDPDVIMVGEIRDSETALIAVEAALTGHLVFSTIHTNDAPGAMTRLHNMGVEPFLITSAIIGAVGQRLLRKVCQHCAQEDKPDLDLLKAFGVSDAQIQIANFRKGRGCPKCSGRGYRGRSAAYEVMKVSDPLREAVLRVAGGAELKQITRNDGMMTMREAGLLKVLSGETTLEEVCRTLLTEEDSDIPEHMRTAAAQHAIQKPKETPPLANLK
jgi:type II secretory ATPase GspE/PulE/Tfp pilus assembly ATPase PilB-like protein